MKKSPIGLQVLCIISFIKIIPFFLWGIPSTWLQSTPTLFAHNRAFRKVWSGQLDYSGTCWLVNWLIELTQSHFPKSPLIISFIIISNLQQILTINAQLVPSNLYYTMVCALTYHIFSSVRQRKMEFTL